MPSGSAVAPYHQSRDSIARSFRVFRGPSDPPSMAQEIRLRANVEMFEPQPEILRSRLVRTSRGPLWALATTNLVCIVHARGSACAPRVRAIGMGVLLGVFSPPDPRHHRMHNFLVLGLVPDDVIQAVASINGSRRIVVDAKQNIVSVAGDQPIQLAQLLRR